MCRSDTDCLSIDDTDENYKQSALQLCVSYRTVRLEMKIEITTHRLRAKSEMLFFPICSFALTFEYSS